MASENERNISAANNRILSMLRGMPSRYTRYITHVIYARYLRTLAFLIRNGAICREVLPSHALDNWLSFKNSGDLILHISLL